MKFEITIEEEDKDVFEKLLSSLIENGFDQQRKKESEKKLLTFSEAVDYLGIAASTLHNWKSQGRISFNRIGKRIYFSKEQILNALEKDKHYEKMRKLKTNNEN